ncbi:YbjQ family protein [Baaleninema sp.]|uniref:YbjQ family protein n=1 Tax=Baaleninema sp. TaxID=3101197 RepID=UPI003D08CABB
MILTTLEGVPGKEIIKHYGIVQGSTVRAKNIARDMGAGLQNIVGGELKGYTEPLPNARHTMLFVGIVVISSDYFKTFMMYFRNLIGGQVVAYESLLDRGRREALLRVKEQAIQWGAREILNVRYETSEVGGGFPERGGPVSIEVIAYGTGIR